MKYFFETRVFFLFGLFALLSAISCKKSSITTSAFFNWSYKGASYTAAQSRAGKPVFNTYVIQGTTSDFIRPEVTIGLPEIRVGIYTMDEAYIQYCDRSNSIYYYDVSGTLNITARDGNTLSGNFSVLLESGESVTGNFSNIEIRL